MLSALDQFYFNKDEPLKSHLITLRELILMQDQLITPAWKYGMPFFVTRVKCLCIYGLIKKQINRIWVL